MNIQKFNKMKAVLIGSSVLLGLLASWKAFGIAQVMSESHRANQNWTLAQTSTTAPTSQVAAANTRFGFKLLTKILEQEGSSNVMISPSSVAIALSMTYNGAQGETQRSIAQTLEMQGLNLEDVNQANAALEQALENADPQVKLAIANSLWGRQGIDFNGGFLQRSREFYHAEVTTLDFAQPAAVDTINGWVNRSTEGKITQILGAISPDAALFLINAVYFKGNWTEPFNPNDTVNRPFHLTDGSQKQHPLMVQLGRYSYLENEQFQAISLPYGEKRLSMYVFLPRENSSLSTFQRSLTAENWADWMARLTPREGIIQLPKFKLEYGIELSKVLKAMGMEDAFDPARADFSGISSEPLFISEVRHKTFIEVNEEGTEAAAATSVGVTRASAPTNPPFQMVVDRPFFYAIRDNQTGAILFMGTVVNPD